MLHSRFFWKLYGSYVVLVVLTVSVVIILVDNRLARELTKEVEETLKVKATLVREVVAPYLDNCATSSLQDRVVLLGGEVSTRITVICPDGRVIADSSVLDPSVMENHLDRPEIVQAFEEGYGISVRFSTTIGQKMMYLAVPVKRDGEVIGFVRTAIPIDVVSRKLSLWRAGVIVGGIVGTVLAFLIGFVVASRITSRLSVMNKAVRAVAGGNYDVKVRVQGKDELGELAASVNLMASQLKERLETIAKSHGELLAIISSMVEGVIAIDGEDKVIYVNEVAGKILGIDPSSSRGKSVWEVTRLRAVSDVLTEVKRSGEERKVVTRLVSGGKQIEVELHASPMWGSEGKISGAVLLIHDVSELRKLETVRRDFVANVSHELRTPLTAIRGMVETILDDPDMDVEQRRKFLTSINTHVERLSNILNDLLTLSRIESGESVPFTKSVDLRLVAKESMEAFLVQADSKRIVLESEFSESPVMVRGSEEALRQIIDNLIDNAVKYTPEEGRIWVRVMEKNGEAVLEVQDTGIGIPESELERIFERFYTVDKARSRKMGGTGLGLSIVKHAVRSLKGEIKVRSELGKGSTFTVTFPEASSS